MKKQIRASLTLFATISIMLIAQLLFTLLEAARFAELKKIATVTADATVESLFAEYCQPLWDNYKLLAIDAANSNGLVDFKYEEELIKRLNQEYFVVPDLYPGNRPVNLLRLGVDKVSPNSYTLITDSNGEVYKKLVSTYMQNNIGYETAKLLYDDYQAIDSVTKNNNVNQSGVGNAQKELKKLSNASKGSTPSTTRAKSKTTTGTKTGIKTGTGTNKQADSKDSKVVNPLDSVEKTQKKGILSVVMKDMEVSKKYVDLTDCVSKRSRQQGLNTPVVNTTWYDDALLEEYLLNNMSFYGNTKENKALSYEIEYIIAGNNSDEKNLKNVVNKILLIREAANMAYLMSNPSKQGEVTALAVALGGISLNPGVIKAIEYGLLAGWAYCESILDLRALLSGEKIPIMKNDMTWTSDLMEIPALLSGNRKAKSVSTGMNYKGYLGTLLLLNSDSTKCYRAMDIQEKTIRQIEGYSSFKMDNLICQTSVEIEYSFYTVFSNMVNIGEISSNHFYIVRDSGYSYIK